MAYDILIVDDSRLMREIIARTVRMSGLEVGTLHQAGDGQAALAQVRAAPIDLILLDINMPVMDGETFLAALRADPRYKGIPVVVASTESSDARIRRLRLMGAEFVHKPFNPEELCAAVSRATAARG
jgi:two-component system chemotaxis response regulator CheY